MSLLLLGCVYLSFHLLAYVLMWRHLAAFSRERMIFAYHAGSAALFALGLAVLVGSGVVAASPLAAAGAWSLHGIYSLSFLELWSLAEDSYSLSILSRVGAGARDSKPLDATALHAIGTRKKSGRLGGLVRLGLLKAVGDRYALTSPGRIVAAGLSLVAWLAHLKETG